MNKDQQVDNELVERFIKKICWAYAPSEGEMVKKWQSFRDSFSVKEEQKAAPIKDARDYAIRKGKVLERFTQDFFTRHKDNSLYRNVYEALIRDADPYEIIERLIEINAEQYAHIVEITPWVSPNYALHKQKEGK